MTVRPWTGIDVEFVGLQGYFRLFLLDEGAETREVTSKVTKQWQRKWFSNCVV